MRLLSFEVFERKLRLRCVGTHWQCGRGTGRAFNLIPSPLQVREHVAGSPDVALRSLMGPSFFGTLLRLSQARARVDLSDCVNEDHALDVVELLQEVLYDLDAGDPTPRGAPRTSRAKDAQCLLKALQAKAVRGAGRMFAVPELRELAAAAGVKEVSAAVTRLNEEGLLLKVRDGYRLNDAEDL